MRTLFADTFYFLAILNPKDAAHDAAVAFSQRTGFRVLTTAWIITEVADALVIGSERVAFSSFLNGLWSDPDTTVLPPTADLFEDGISLFTRRLDKTWPLTDCISFVAMKRHGINEALTADRHFQQAGFIALFA